MATSNNGYDVTVNGGEGFLGSAYRNDENQARATFASRVSQRTSADIVRLVFNGRVVLEKYGERKNSGKVK